MKFCFAKREFEDRAEAVFVFREALGMRIRKAFPVGEQALAGYSDTSKEVGRVRSACCLGSSKVFCRGLRKFFRAGFQSAFGEGHV
jgi:hypothetical protein